MHLAKLIFTTLATTAFAAPTDPFLGIEKFVDELPLLPHIAAGRGDDRDILITATEFKTQVHRDLPPMLTWGYNGTVPGPIIDAERNLTVRIRWRNDLGPTHLFPLPAGADPIEPDVRTVTHLHGAAVREANPMDRGQNNDGWPDAWITSGGEQYASYPNRQSARMLWYHDHAMGTTGRNVAAGLAGAYFIHDHYERSLQLPSGDFAMPLLLQTRQLNNNHTFGYTDDITSEFYGNMATVNGKLWPYRNVEPRKYRFRIVNMANARNFALQLLGKTDHQPGPPFTQIGNDGGFLEHAAVLNNPNLPDSPRLVLAPAERADVIIDFSAYAGKDLILHNSARDGDREYYIPDIMLLRVGTKLSHTDTSKQPMRLRPIPHLNANVATTRQIVFDQMTMPNGTTMMMLNGKAWHDPLTERPVLGTTEIWELINTLENTHPFHIHLTNFQVLGRRPFDVAQYRGNGRIAYTGPEVPPDANELGWKDTVRVSPEAVTRIIMKFAPFTGYYVYHCHILEHEDMDMMRPFQVIFPPRP